MWWVTLGHSLPSLGFGGRVCKGGASPERSQGSLLAGALGPARSWSSARLLYGAEAGREGGREGGYADGVGVAVLPQGGVAAVEFSCIPALGQAVMAERTGDLQHTRHEA